MKTNTHPTWQHDTTVTCSCGSVFTTGSSVSTITVDICSACHPFFTGEMRFVDRQGRVDKFNKAIKAAEGTKGSISSKRAKKVKKLTDDEAALSYRQILQQQRSTVKVTPAAAPAVTDKPATDTTAPVEETK